MVKRKTPIRHEVRGYTKRDGTRVPSYHRGSGIRVQRPSKSVKSSRIELDPIDYVQDIEKVNGKYVGWADWAYDTPLQALYKKMLRLEKTHIFYDVGADSDTFSVVAIPNKNQDRIYAGKGVKKITPEEIWDNITGPGQKEYLEREYGVTG